MLRSIKTQMLMGQFLLVALLTLALGGGVYHVAAGILVSKEEEKLRLLAGGLARETALAAGYDEVSLRLLATSLQFDQFHETHNYHLLQSLFDRYRAAFTALAYVNPQGVREYAASGPGYTDRDEDLSADQLVAEALAAPGRIVPGLRISQEGAKPLLVLALARSTPFGRAMGVLLAAQPVTTIAQGVLGLHLEEGGGAGLADTSGRLLFAPELDTLPVAAGGQSALGSLLARQQPGVVQENFHGQPFFLATAPVGKYGLSTLVAVPRLVAIDDKMRRLRRLVAAIAAAAAFISTLAAACWTDGIARPLARLAASARAASGGDLSVRAPVAGPVEAREVAQAFNAMTKGLACSREQLSRAMRSLESILATMNEAILVVDRQGRLTMLNRAGRDMLGYAPGEAEGLPAAAFFPKDEPLCAFLESAPAQDLLGGGGVTGLEKILRGKDGKNVPVLVSMALLRGPEDEQSGVVCLAMDITERKRAEDLARARKSAEAISRAKTEFLAVLSHEMRTPLNIILGILEHLTDLPLPAATSGGVRQAMAAGQTLHDVIVAMLDYASLEAGRVILRRQPFCPRRLAAEVAERFAALAGQRGVALSVDVAPDTPERLVGDPARLTQVLANLLSNAVRFTQDGKASLFLGIVPPGQAGADRPRLLVRISDTGPGVPDAKLDYIFEPFTQEDASSTRRFGGLGLGLAISRRLVGLMRGAICMDSRVGQGTDVYVSLPVEKAETA